MNYKQQNKNKITRNQEHRKGSIIDHVIMPKYVDCSVKAENVTISDHNIMIVEAELNNHQPMNKTDKLITKTDYTKMNKLQIQNIKPVDNLSQLASVLKTSKKICTSQKRLVMKYDNEWYNRKTQNIMIRRDKVYRKMRKHPRNEEYKANFDKLKQTNKYVKEAKPRYINHKLISAENDMRKLWGTINNIVGKKKTSETKIEQLKVGSVTY
ncbi:hypothetical protein HHI36_017179 [Cryptolaemus montrouzieri]|uniref:Uncharacterized protein n=1 Tax=Cryptolaemus montrouzieri TaxID=559131 RepID=A0ABD2NLS6_9CUCU